MSIDTHGFNMPGLFRPKKINNLFSERWHVWKTASSTINTYVNEQSFSLLTWDFYQVNDCLIFEYLHCQCLKLRWFSIVDVDRQLFQNLRSSKRISHWSISIDDQIVAHTSSLLNTVRISIDTRVVRREKSAELIVLFSMKLIFENLVSFVRHIGPLNPSIVSIQTGEYNVRISIAILRFRRMVRFDRFERVHRSSNNADRNHAYSHKRTCQNPSSNREYE